MRSTIPATLLTLGCCFILSSHVIGCAEPNTGPSTGGSGGTGGDATGGGGTGGIGGTGGEGGGPPPCEPVAETCDGMDNDCDEQVDEDCPCIDGQTQSCYSGPAGTQGIGPCASGQQTCDNTGTWGPCVGQVVPKTKELCNLVDDDCNGAADDMGNTSCGVGACQVTVVTCESGQLNQCIPNAPTLEVCDGIDNNCNQLVDETFPDNGKACASDLAGACAVGKTACTAAALTCVPDVMPKAETCNDIDDDCDGTVDNNIPGTGFDCGTGFLGVCAAGTISCKGGQIDCFPIVNPSGEKCNGIDDDCDGTVDENNPGGNVICDTGKPDLCSAGTTLCTSGVLQCLPNLSNAVETCNGIDDDCDGTVDENNPGGGVACGCNGTRACVTGKLECQGGPKVFLEEDFSNTSGWTLDNDWEIKAPPMMVTCGDPTTDTSPTSDNMIAGVNVGGCAPSTVHGYYYLTSPVMNTAAAPKVILSFQRWLRTDIAPYMNSVVQVFNGANWYTVYQNGPLSVADVAWTKVTYDISTYKNANMRIRWGFNIGQVGVIASGSWNIDDVLVMDNTCP